MKGSDFLYPGAKSHIVSVAGRDAAMDGMLTTKELARVVTFLETDDSLGDVAAYYQERFAIEFKRADIGGMDGWSAVVLQPDYQAIITIGAPKTGGPTLVCLNPRKPVR